MENSKKKNIILIIVSIIGVYLALFGINCFNKYMLRQIPLILRMIVVPVIYWFIATIPIILMIVNKDRLSDLGLKKEKLLKQIIIGIVIGLIMSLFITLIPIIIFGKENIYTGSNFKYLWQFIYQLFYLIFGVALTEEFIFRGYMLDKLKGISNNKIIPIIVSSILFGLFHIFNGNIIQLFGTAFIGLILSLCKEKIKDCTLISVIIAHGLYDWLIEILIVIL